MDIQTHIFNAFVEYFRSQTLNTEHHILLTKKQFKVIALFIVYIRRYSISVYIRSDSRVIIKVKVMLSYIVDSNWETFAIFGKVHCLLDIFSKNDMKKVEWEFVFSL